MDAQERYDELENIESTLRVLIDEITDEDYKDQLQLIMYDAQNEKEEVEEQLRVEYDAEEREMNRQYERSQI